MNESKLGGTRGQGVIGILFFFACVLLLSWFLGMQIGTTAAAPAALVLVAGIAVCLLTFVNPDAGFIVLIFSMLLSPELRVAQVPQRSVVVRVDDILLFLVFITWWARLALRRELSILRHTPLNVPLLLFLFVCGLSTALGIVGGSVTSPKESLFYLLKYAEYFLIYFMFASQLRTREQLRRFLSALIMTCLIVTIIGYVQMAQGAGRVSAPFEGAKGEPNTLAGYFVLLGAVLWGLALHASSDRLRLGAVLVSLAILPPLLATLSRGGFVAMIAAYLTLIGLARPRQRVFLVGLLLVAALAFPAIASNAMRERVSYTFTARGRVVVAGHAVDPATAQRIEVWGWIFNKVKERPLFGYGVTGVGLVDQQYALVLGEVGLVGMLIYLWTRWLIWIHGLRVLRRATDPLERGLATGFLAGFVGLLVHSFAGNIFIIVRIMEPFWCLAAMVMVLPELRPSQIGVAERPAGG